MYTLTLKDATGREASMTFPAFPTEIENHLLLRMYFEPACVALLEEFRPTAVMCGCPNWLECEHPWPVLLRSLQFDGPIGASKA